MNRVAGVYKASPDLVGQAIHKHRHHINGHLYRCRDLSTVIGAPETPWWHTAARFVGFAGLTALVFRAHSFVRRMCTAPASVLGTYLEDVNVAIGGVVGMDRMQPVLGPVMWPIRLTQFAIGSTIMRGLSATGALYDSPISRAATNYFQRPRLYRILTASILTAGVEEELLKLVLERLTGSKVIPAFICATGDCITNGDRKSVV